MGLQENFNNFKTHFSKLQVSDFKYLGTGFLWAWIYSAFETSALYPDRMGIGIDASPSWIAWALTTGLGLIIAGIVLRNYNLKDLVWMQYSAPLLMAVGTLVSALFSEQNFFVGVTSGIVMGVGIALLTIMWADSLSRIEIEKMEILIPGAFVITIICSIVIPHLPLTLSIFSVVLLPLASGFLLLLSYRDNLSPKYVLPSEKSTEFLVGRLIRLAIVLFVSYVVLGWFEARTGFQDIFQAEYGIDVATTLGSSFAFVLVVLFIFYSAKIDFVSVYRFLAPLIILGLALAPYSSLIPDFLCRTIVVIANTTFMTLTFVYFITQTKHLSVHVIMGIGVAHGVMVLGLLCGSAFGNMTEAITMNDSAVLFAMVSALTVLFAFSVALIPQRKNTLYQQLQRVSVEERSIEQVCEILSDKYGLTNKEREILRFLAKGRSQPYIREALLLSKSTVSTHVIHIYQKMNIHSKQELLNMFEYEKG